MPSSRPTISSHYRKGINQRHGSKCDRLLHPLCQSQCVTVFPTKISIKNNSFCSSSNHPFCE